MGLKILLEPGEVKVNPKTGNPDKRITHGSFKRWQPRVWTPVMEQMVVLSCANWSNGSIASQFGCSSQHVSNVLNCEEGKKVKEKLVVGLRSLAEGSIQDRLKNLADRALRNIEDVITSQSALNDSPMAMFDRSLKVLEITKHVEDPANKKNQTIGGINIERAIVLSPEHSAQLTSGLEKANAAAILHGNVEIMEKIPTKKKENV